MQVYLHIQQQDISTKWS